MPNDGGGSTKRVVNRKIGIKKKAKLRKKIARHTVKRNKQDQAGRQRAAAEANQKREAARANGGAVEEERPSGPTPEQEQAINDMMFRRAQELADAKRGGPKACAIEISALRAAAGRKQADFETRKRARLTEEFQSDKDNSKKAFYKEFKKVVELADVIIMVLDARDPLACRCTDVERYIRQSNPNKRIILLLNKMDLVPREVGEKWLKFFREELPTVAFKCSTQSQNTNLGRKKMPSAKGMNDDGLQGSSCLGADTLLMLLKNYCRNTGIKTSITVGVVGLPNVGKSSLINSLKRARVGNTPGVTKSLQEVTLDKNIKLLDSPGIVFAAAESDSAAVLRNCVKIERLVDPVAPIAEILKRVPAAKLQALYKIMPFTGADHFLQLVAAARGKLRKGGIPDMVAAAKVTLQDWNDGRIPYYTSPPSRGNEEFASAEVVGLWAKEFDAELVFASERSAVIAHLPTMADDAAAGRDAFMLESVGGTKVDFEAMEAADVLETGDRAEPTGRGGGGLDDEDDEEYGRPAKRQARAGEPGAVTAILYGEEGQFNPHAARQQRKKAKKGPDRAAVVAAAIAAKVERLRRELEESAAESESGDGSGSDGGEDGMGKIGDGAGLDGNAMND
ncbi:hypothetical protein FOA52_012959 [Chlamydomonas sp. UWO 241]|nr:hypothetical protein FOA52_012959 [Chlamydomonas sp. UWO 241]